MQLEELLAALKGSGGAGGINTDTFQVIPHESGNTVIADNRSASERPGFWGTPEGRALMANNRDLSLQSAQRGLEGYNLNYTTSLAKPYTQGPLPDYEHLTQDPKWWELYSSNQGLADRIFGATHGTSFTQAIKDAETQKEFATKTLQGMVAKREIWQDAKGEWQQLIQEPDELGQMKSKVIPLSGEMASLMQRAGGPEGLGITNIKRALMMKGVLTQPTPAPSPSLQAEPSNTVPPLFGIPRALEQTQRRLQTEGLESLAVENPDTVPTSLQNLVTRFTGGTLQSPPDPREIPRQDPQRLMINILRSRKGLPPMSDDMWRLFQTHQAGKAMLQ